MEKDYLTSLQRSEINVEFTLVLEQPHDCFVRQPCLLGHEISRNMENFETEIHHEDSDFPHHVLQEKQTKKWLSDRKKMLKTLSGLVLRKSFTTYQSRWCKNGE